MKNKRHPAFRIVALGFAASAFALMTTAQTSASKLYGEDTEQIKAIQDDARARSVSTYEDDLELTNHCIESGQDKEACLCVTQTLKYKLTVGEYHAAAMQFSTAVPDDTYTDAEIILAKAEGRSDLERREMARTFKTLTEKRGFERRCRTAKRYFRKSKQG